jgi:hypothetical protein
MRGRNVCNDGGGDLWRFYFFLLVNFEGEAEFHFGKFLFMLGECLVGNF